jgi:hypothetical protein
VRPGCRVKRHRPLGAELAERDPQPAAGRAVVDDAVELQVEQLAQPQPHAAQHQQPAAGERVGQLGDRGHERAVLVGAERPRQRPGQAWHVGGEHQLASRPLGPPEVIEEVTHHKHGGVHHAGRHRPGPPGPGDPPTPRPGRVPGQERLDVAALELAKGTHLGVPLAEELTEDGQALHQAGDRGRAQHGAADLDVAHHHPADLGRGDHGQPFGDRGAPSAPLGWDVQDPTLIENAAQAMQAGVVGLAGGGRAGRGGIQRGREPVQVGGGELTHPATAPGQHQRQALSHDVQCPPWAPPQPHTGRPGTGDILSEHHLGRAAEPAEVLGDQQVDVDAHATSQHRVADQRPSLDPAQIGQAGSQRAGHPGVQVGMAGQELPGQAQPVAQRPIAELQGPTVDHIAAQQRMVGRGGHASDRGGHRAIPVSLAASTARAAAYSAARCSADRCT